MKKNRIIFTTVVMVLIVACFVFAKVFSDLRKENQIKKEITEITKVFGTKNIDDDDVNAILERRIFGKGNYGTVESSVKEYYKDLYSYLKNITFLMDDDNFSNYLSSKNIEDDGPSFTKSINTILTTKSQLNDKYQEFNDQLTNEAKKISYIYGEDIDTYYKSLYLELINENTPSNLADDLKSTYEKTLKKIDLYSEAFAFLTANEAHWRIVDSVLTFDDTTLYDEYKKITDSIEEVTTQINEIQNKTS